MPRQAAAQQLNDVSGESAVIFKSFHISRLSPWYCLAMSLIHACICAVENNRKEVEMDTVNGIAEAPPSSVGRNDQ